MTNQVLFVGGPLHGKKITSNGRHFHTPIYDQPRPLYNAQAARDYVGTLVAATVPPLIQTPRVFTYRREVIRDPRELGEWVVFVPEEVRPQRVIDYVLVTMLEAAHAALGGG